MPLMPCSTTPEEFQRLFPAKELRWFPGFDAALVGVAVRRDEAVPAYGLQLYVAELARDMPVDAAWARANRDMAGALHAAFLWPPYRDRFWDQVRAGELQVWEHLTPAICAVAKPPLLFDTVVCYDWNKAVDALVQASADPPGMTDAEKFRDAEAKLSSLMLADFGPTTSYFLIT